MIGFRMGNTVFDSFFDRRTVIDAMTPVERRWQSAFGFAVRRSAKLSIRKRKGISKPGKPPASHEGSLKKKIFFAYDSSQRRMIVGPIQFGNTMVGGKTVPEILEEGGSATLRGKRVTYLPRPYMVPALNRVLPKVPEMIRQAQLT